MTAPTDTRIELIEYHRQRRERWPVASVIEQHGLGADGSDFVPVAQAIDLSAVRAGALRVPLCPGAAGDPQRWPRDARLVRHLSAAADGTRQDEPVCARAWPWCSS